MFLSFHVFHFTWMQTSSKPVEQSKPKEDIQPPAEAMKAFSGVRTCKFRHVHGVPMHKSNNIENIRNLSMSTFGDCDGLQANREFVAFPLAGPGGQLAVLQVSFTLDSILTHHTHTHTLAETLLEQS